MGGFSSTFDGIQRASWEATCAPDDDVSVPQPQHLSTNNNDPRCSKRSVRKQRRGTDLKAASSVMGQAGVPNTASQPRKTRKKFTPEEDALLIRLKVTEEKKWSKIAESFPGRTSGALQARFCRELKPKPTDELSQGATSRTGSEEL
ncbi:MYB DNA-binding domain-containing protein [Fusarium globosum]|uniref:MYB DNA-binding domain-containing protein n=1 Tax=Fusarium globosum TaxID=78864 RepID=A0A8H6DCR9_9HYPO|nr:MYB DNA-binding domain-containing protein [Fusarium globosum]